MRNFRLNRAKKTIALTAIIGGLATAVIHASFWNESMEYGVRIARATGTEISNIIPLSEEEWENFKRHKENILRSTLTLQIPILTEGENPLTLMEWSIPLANHEDWILSKREWLVTTATLDPTKVASFLEEEIVPSIPGAVHTEIASAQLIEKTLYHSAAEDETSYVLRAEAEGRMKDGWQLDMEEAAKNIALAAENNQFTVFLPVEKAEGKIVNTTGMYLGDIQLLALGHSDFSGSIPERILNIKKALNEHLNGILIPPGETFSFVDAMGGVIEKSTGWAVAMGIFNGNEIKPTPGGGVCQASTTTYRAAMAAGLPIEEQRNHSMYIKYYKKYGEGLDATVYPGHQDLKFVNDTPGYLLILAHVDGNEAFVEIYGTPDGRQVVLEGPYRRDDAPDDVKNYRDGKFLWWQDIAWKRTVTRRGKKPESEIRVSHYQDEIPYTGTPYDFL